jgi:hypothetical protein
VCVAAGSAVQGCVSRRVSGAAQAREMQGHSDDCNTKASPMQVPRHDRWLAKRAVRGAKPVLASPPVKVRVVRHGFVLPPGTNG